MTRARMDKPKTKQSQSPAESESAARYGMHERLEPRPPHALPVEGCSLRAAACTPRRMIHTVFLMILRTVDALRWLKPPFLNTSATSSLLPCAS
jgi:hypothetical protein